MSRLNYYIQLQTVEKDLQKVSTKVSLRVQRSLTLVETFAFC